LSALRLGTDLLNTNSVDPLKILSPPSLLELLEYLPWRIIATKEAYWQSALHRISQMLRNSGNLFHAEEGFDPHTHLVKARKCAVIDCTRLSTWLRGILANLIALRLLFPRITLRQVSSKTNFFYCIDESDDIISREACRIYLEGFNKSGVIEKRGREFGITNCFITTSAGRCDPIFSANASYYFVKNQSDPVSATSAAQTLLEPKSTQLISSLEPKEMVYKESMGKIPYAMLVNSDYIQPSDMLQPDKFDQLPFTPARSMNDIPGFKDRLDELIKKLKVVILRQDRTKSAISPLSQKERIFLDLMSLYEYEPLHRIFSRMGNLSPATQRNIIKKLKTKGLIDYDSIRTSKSYIRLGCLTEEGWTFLNKKSKYKPLRGKMIHTHICRWKQSFDLKNGAQESICEFPIPQTTGYSDVGSRFNSIIHCTEVIVECTSNICHHARDCFIKSKAVESLTFVTLLKSEHPKIRDMIMSDPELVFFINRINFMTVDQILKGLWL
jgi:predicted transcriptional regulator